MNALLCVIGVMVNTHQTAVRRLRCARRGHRWLPALGVTMCRDCGLYRD